MKIDANSYAADTAADATITLTGETGRRWEIGGLAWSYEGTSLSTDAGIYIWRVDTTQSSQIMFAVQITAFGPGFFVPAQPLVFATEDDILVELINGGAGNVGRINVMGVRKV